MVTEEKGVPCKFCSYHLHFGVQRCKFTNIALKMNENSAAANFELIVWQVVQALDLIATLANDKAPDFLNQLFNK